MKLIETRTGRQINIGDMATTFRHELVKVVGTFPPTHSPSTGRVEIETYSGHRALFYPGVIGCKFVEEDLVTQGISSEGET